MVAGAVAGRLGDALALKKYPRMRPGARRHLNVDVFSNALQPDDAAEHRLRHRYSCVRVHVAPLPPKVLRFGHPESDENLLFADGHAHRLPVFDARRDRNHDLLPRPHLASAPAVTAGHLDPGSFAMTPPAASRPHHEGSRADGFHAGAVALRTTLRAGSRVGARPLALDALVRHRHRELFVAPSGRIGKAQ